VDEDSWPLVDDPRIMFTGPSPRGWHRLQKAAECLQQYAWAYENGPREDISKKPPLAIGSLLHLALAQWYSRMKQEQEGKNPNEYMDPIEAVRFIADLQGISKHVPNVAQTFRAYEQRYWQDINTRRIVAVEVLYDGTVGKYRLTGRLDLMYEDLAGFLWAEDHKTTGRLTKKHKEFFAISGQMLGYEHIVRQKNPRLAGFKINLIQHAGSQDPKFERITLPARPALSKQFVARAIDIEESIERVKAEGRPVDEWPKAMSELTCYHRYGPCDYIDKCRFGPNAKKGGAWVFDEDDWG